MNVRYAVVGCCFFVAALLMIVSANSNSKGECRNWSARYVTSIFIPCIDRVEVNDPLNIGTPLGKQPDTESKR
jgi:hypothetical protein